MTESKLAYFFQKAGDVHKLYLYDDVSKFGKFNWATWSYEDSETSAKYFRDKLDEIPDDGTIELHINSAGGEVGEGVTIYNLLKQKGQAGAKIIGYIDGYAYSVAMDIAMACEEIHMGLGTSMLLHYPWARVAGNAVHLRNIADQLDALGTASVALYLARADGKIEESELREMMEKETTLDPESCLKYGFCDVVDEYKAKEPEDSDDPQMMQQMIDQLKQQLTETRQQLFAQQEANLAMRPLIKQEEKTPDRGETLREAMKMFKGGRNV